MTGRGGILADAMVLAPVAVLAMLAYLAVFTVLQADPFSAAAVWLPLGAPMAVFGAIVVARAGMGRPGALIALLGLLTVGLSINFRTRELGEVGLDFQNGAKLVAWGMVFAIALVRLPRCRPILARGPMLCLLAYCGVGMLSALWSEVPLYTFGSAFGLLAFVLFGAVLVQAMPLDRLLRATTAWLALYAAINLASLVALPDIALAAPSAEEVSWRVRGIAGHPNVLGHQMVVTLLLAFTCGMQRLVRPGWLVLLAVVAGGLLVASGSRTSLITCVVTIAVVLLRRRPVLLVAGGTAAAAVVAILVAFPADVLQDVFASLSRSGDVREMMTLTGRTDIWAFGLDKISQRPLLGYGYNGAEPVLTRELETEDAHATINLHNIYLQSAFGVGLLGSLPLAGVLAWLAAGFVARPSIARDTFFLCQMLAGLAEVEAFGGTPGLMTLILMVLIAAHVQPVAPTSATRS